MTETLQILQVTLFAIPILALLLIGVAILIRSVSSVDRRWFLAILIPLLLANTLTIFTSNSQLQTSWRTWLILGVNLVLILGAISVMRGFQVYGLTAEQVETRLSVILRQQEFDLTTHHADKRDLWGRTRDATVLTVKKADCEHIFWITTQFNEVLIQAKGYTDLKIIRQMLPVLRDEKVPYELQAHLTGVLYIVLALVFGVLTWIFFFEPRLILID